MSPLAVGPIIALLGIVATFYLLRNKARVRKSMYRTLRDERERQLRHARERALAARSAAARATEAASAPAAASPAATAERASTAYVGVPTQEVQQPPAALGAIRLGQHTHYCVARSQQSFQCRHREIRCPSESDAQPAHR